MKESTAKRPDAKTIIDTIVEAMQKGAEPFDEDFSLVPSEFEVELHPEAYTELESFFSLIQERAVVRLDRELETLNRTGGSFLGRMLGWLKRDEPDVETPEASSNRYRPAGFGWQVRFNMTLDSQADIGYIAVVALLTAPRRDNLSGPKTRRLTVRSADGSFKTRKIQLDDQPVTSAPAPSVAEAPPGPKDTMRTTAPQAAPAASGQPTPITPKQTASAAPGHPLARLSFKDDNGPRTFTMNRQEIIVGRHDTEETGVDLQLHTLPDVSRHHLRLRYDPDQKTFLIKDISSYGTTIDGRPVTPSVDKATQQDLNHWEPLPPETTIGLAGILFIDFKSLV